jgi:hypothetical protein
MINRLLGGLATLALAGVGLTMFVFWGGNMTTPGRFSYAPDPVNGVPAYDVNDGAPTSYGDLTETAVHLDSSGDTPQIDISLSVDNHQLLPMRVPTLGQFRVINQAGDEATYLGGGFHEGQIVLPHWSASANFRFAAPPSGGMLLLEYREHADDTPVRIAVGYVLDGPQAAHPSL